MVVTDDMGTVNIIIINTLYLLIFRLEYLNILMSHKMLGL